MAPTPAHLEAFAPLKWALPFLLSPSWSVNERDRGPTAIKDGVDRHCSVAMRGPDGVEHWLELVQPPAPGSKIVNKTVSLCKYGAGLNGFPGITHGGAAMTLMDEALGFAMVASETALRGEWGVRLDYMDSLAAGKPLAEILNGALVTARLDVKFLGLMPCPGIVGIEVDILERAGHKMKIRGVMKDENGTPLMQADGLWVRVGGAKI